MLFAGMLAVGAPGMAEAQANAADSVMNHANGRRLSVGGYGEVAYSRNFYSDNGFRFTNPSKYNNVSWGAYWSWDPKETWALITFMVYAVVLHTQSLPVFSRPRAYHLYMSLAFLSILMAFFGVNYVLGGMHSYA